MTPSRNSFNLTADIHKMANEKMAEISSEIWAKAGGTYLASVYFRPRGEGPWPGEEKT